MPELVEAPLPSVTQFFSPSSPFRRLFHPRTAQPFSDDRVSLPRLAFGKGANRGLRDNPSPSAQTRGSSVLNPQSAIVEPDPTRQGLIMGPPKRPRACVGSKEAEMDLHLPRCFRSPAGL